MAAIALNLLGEVSHAAPRTDGLVAGVARTFSPDYRQTERRLIEVDRDLADLPALTAAPFATRYGFRSENLLTEDQPEWLQIDLTRSRLIDRIVAMPAFIPTLGERGEGYGFPRRFKIEVSENPDMQNAVTVVNRTAEDVRNPGRFPEDFKIDPIQGRYVRMTSTRHFPVQDGYIWALEELLVLCGNQPASVWNPVSSSSSFERFPNWSEWRVQDGQSTLGMPVSTESSPTRGFLSGLADGPKAKMWIQVDFGTEQEIDQVLLMPVGQEGFEMLETGSFPRGYRAQLARDPEFEDVVWQYERETTNLIGFPGDCGVAMSVPGKRARYLRLETLDLWGDRGRHGFGLAEIQAYSGDENVALGRTVTVSHDGRAGEVWSPDFVTDGCGSQYRLLEWPDYLDRISRRADLIRESRELQVRQEKKLQNTSLILGYGGGSLGALALLGCGWLLVRQRHSRRQAVARMREQIARDLHDDIGTNLGGIVLVSEVGSRQCGDPIARQDFATIRETAVQTSQSMQDIVWLIERGNTSLRQLISRMRQVAELILGEVGSSLEVDPPDFRDRKLSLFFRRHLFFAFKETLHNVRRHAGASTVRIRIKVDRRELVFEVVDDGCGFDPENPSPEGHGLANLKRRAKRLNGSCLIESQPDQGTRVTFRSSIPSSQS